MVYVYLTMFIRFNRGSLANVGFLEYQNEFDYFAIHDVDLLPMMPHIDYSYPEKGPKHLIPYDVHPSYTYKNFTGGILLLTRNQYLKANGHSNKYWGWGREDDDFSQRMELAGLKVTL